MNKRNYHNEFVNIVNALGETKPKLLLHVCCAPCSTFCLLQLVSHFDITLYYSNDNITDSNEWDKRLSEVTRLVDIVNNGAFEVVPACTLKLLFKQLNSSNYLYTVKDNHSDAEGGQRCYLCYNMRLCDTAKYAKDNGYDYFATTLTVSPYKNSQWINEIGLALEKELAIKYLPSDFKKQDGYNTSIRLSNKYGLYRQHYCGCIFSKNATI